MNRYIVYGVLCWGIPTGLAFNAVIRLLLGRPWPTGLLLAANCVLWPVAGAAFGWRMYRWKQKQRASESPTLTELR